MDFWEFVGACMIVKYVVPFGIMILCGIWCLIFER